MTRGRILIVEDESLVAEDIDTCLKRSGYQVVGIADSCASAKQIAEQERPDMALLDIRLKGEGDGIELANEFRRRDIGFVYLTSHSDEGTLARAEVTEPLGYILKPFSTREMLPVLRTAMYRHAAELRLRNVEQWLRTTLQSIGDAVIVTDDAVCVTYVNPTAEKLLQRRLQDVVGQPLRDVLRIVDVGSTEFQECVSVRAMRSGETVFLGPDCELVRMDGSRLPIDDCASAIRDRDGRISGVVVVMRDATERRAVEARRLAAERRMQDAERLQSLGALASGLAHDLNNVLTAILGNATLCRSLAPEGAQEPLAEIEASTRAAAQLCRRMLEGAGAAPVQMVPVEVGAVVGACVARERALAGDLQFLVESAGDVRRVVADELQLMQVVQNLLRNAAEAMAGRAGTVRVRWSAVRLPDVRFRDGRSARLAPGSYVLIEVADDGPGMSPEVQARIFEPFFTTKFTGRGLGLASAHGIVRRHGGAIELQSSPGKGACFRVLWPAATGELPLAVPPLVMDPGAKSSGRVLVVDDDDNVREVACRLLRHAGWTCHEADRGQAALDLLASGLLVDGVLLDMVMPGLSGREVLARMRATHAKLPVLLVSGVVFDQDVAAGDENVSFLAKPYSLDSLLARMSRWMKV